MKGRKRKPTETKIAEGNRGKRKLEPEKEPKFSTSELFPNAKLTEFAQKEWNRIAPIITRAKILTDADTAALTNYCENYAIFCKSTNDIEEQGLYTKTMSGLATHPAVRIQNQASLSMLKFLTEFGMTPASRSKVSVDPESGDEDEFTKFQREREGKRGELREIAGTKKTAKG